MDEKLQLLCDRLVSDKKALKKKMHGEMDSNATSTMSAFLYAGAGKDLDIDRYVECKKILKKNVNIFSEFRGIAFTLVVTKMALSDNPTEYLEGAMTVYKKLRERHKLTASANMVMASLTLYEYGGVERADENIDKLEELYKKLQKDHPLLVCDEDRGFLAMIVASGANIDKVIEEITACFEAGKKIYVFKNAVHSMAQVLSLNSMDTEKKVEKVKELIKGFKAARKPISKEYGLGAVGALTLLNMPTDEIVAKVSEVDDYLKHQKGFKWFSVDTKIRRLYAQLLVMMAYLPEDSSMMTSMISSTIAMVILEEIIMLIIIASTDAAVRSATSSSSN